MSLTCLNETMRHGSIPADDKLQIRSGALRHALDGVRGDGDIVNKNETAANRGSGEYFTVVKSMESRLCLIAGQANQVTGRKESRTMLLGGACHVHSPRGLPIVASLRSCAIPRESAIAIICVIGSVQ